MWITTLALTALSSPCAPPVAPLVAPASRGDHGKIAWFEGSYKDAVRAAKTEDKLIFIDFWTTWCGWCKKLDADTFSADSVVAEMKDVICVNLDAEGMEGGPVARSLGVSSYPTVVFLTADGRPEDFIAGYLGPDEFLVEVRRIKSGKDTLSSFRKRFEADPDDLDARYQYAQKLMRLGGKQEADKELQYIRKVDPEGKSIPMQRLKLEALLKEAVEVYRERQEFNAEAVVKLLADTQHDQICFEGFSTLASLYEQLQQGADCRAAYRKAWATCPDDEKAPFGNTLAWSYWTMRAELEDSDKKLALAAATIANKAEPDNVNFLDTFACCNYMNGKKEEARKAMQRCIELQPDKPTWKIRLREFV